MKRPDERLIEAHADNVSAAMGVELSNQACELARWILELDRRIESWTKLHPRARNVVEFKRIDVLEKALHDLIEGGKSYMEYHANKFYPDSQAPAGLTPELQKAAKVLK